jgi:hypothetical protein
MIVERDRSRHRRCPGCQPEYVAVARFPPLFVIPASLDGATGRRKLDARKVGCERDGKGESR